MNNIPGITNRSALDEDRAMLYMSSPVDQKSRYPASNFSNNAVLNHESVTPLTKTSTWSAASMKRSPPGLRNRPGHFGKVEFPIG